MSTSLQTKSLALVLVLLMLAAFYLFWQKQQLAEQLASNSAQCDLRAAQILNAKPADIKRSVAIIKTQAAKAPGGVKKKNVALKAELNKTGEPDKPKLQRFDESLEQIVSRKYRFLLSRLDLSEAEKQELVRLLMQREELYLKLQDAENYAEVLGLSEADAEDLRYQLQDVDAQIEVLLGSEQNLERYTLLKESDKEQHEFSQYTLGINSLFPLDGEQQEKVLFTRLKHKQAFDQALAQAEGFDGDYPLSQDQFNQIMITLNKAAQHYKQGFLGDVKPALKHDNHPMDQYTLLENYTNTEFQEMVAALEKKLVERGIY